MDAGGTPIRSLQSSLRLPMQSSAMQSSPSRSAGVSVMRVLVAVVLSAGVPGLGGCVAASDTNFMPLPDLASQAPSRQQVMTPAEQKKAIDDLIAQRNQQEAEAKAAK